MELGGLLVYDDTSAMGIEFGHNFYLSNHESRGRVLGMDGWSYKWYDAGGAGSARDAWQIIQADPGITQIGQDGKVFIKNMNTGRHIQDNNGNVRMSSNTGGWEKFHVLDAGGGMVYLRSHRGEYLAVREDTNWGPGLECKVTLYRDRDCRGGTRVVKTTSTAGYEEKNYGRRRRRRRYVYITDCWWSVGASRTSGAPPRVKAIVLRSNSMMKMRVRPCTRIISGSPATLDASISMTWTAVVTWMRTWAA